MVRMLGVLAVTMLLAGAAAAAADPPFPRTPVVRDPVAYQREQHINRLLNRAIRRVERRDAGCRTPNPLERPTTFTDAAPSPGLLGALGVLRRPAGPAEHFRDARFSHLAADGLYRQYVRIARSPSGREFLVFAAQNTNLYTPRPARCAQRLRQIFTNLIAHERRPFRTRARRELEQVIRGEFTGRPGADDPEEGLFLFDYDARGRSNGGGGGIGLEQFRRTGLAMAGEDSRHHAIVSGLVPDGVASISFTFPRVVSYGPVYEPRRYRRTVRRTVRVHDNVYSLTVPRAGEDALGARTVWRDAGGAVIKVLGRP